MLFAPIHSLSARALFWIVTCLLFSLLPDRCAMAQDDTKPFEPVAKILEAKCIECHNDNDRSGELSLQSLKGLLKGGESGHIIVAGDPGNSPILDSVQGDDPAMPQDGEPLTKEEVATLREWIQSGAKWPKDRLLKNGSLADLNWWSLHRLQKPSLPPANSESSMEANPIDAFIAQRHAEKGLSFSQPATRQELIRRVYFDLTGLPPTPAQVKQFVESSDPKAYSKLVDQLLNSPRYGERWARHWLDVVQFGETHGYDKDKLRNNAWPYRDYVIRAFNQDKSYSQFVREQIAGDVFWPNSTDGIVATGFIAAGPWDFIGHAEVPETKIDGMVARNLDRDNMVTSTLNTFCSLTVQCARCHDHKLDPVTMKDYYSLQAVFSSLDRADRFYDIDPAIAEKRKQLMRQIAEVQAKLKDWETRLQARIPNTLQKRQAELKKLQAAAANSTAQATSLPRSGRYGFHSQVAAQQNTVKWVQVDLGKPVPIDQVLLFGADEYGWSDFGFPHRYRVECANDSQFQQAILLHDGERTDQPRPGSRAVVVDSLANKPTARYVRVTATKLWSRRHAGADPTDDWIFALGELAVISGGEPAPIQQVTAVDSIEAMPRWGKANLIDGVYGKHDWETTIGLQLSPTNGYHSLFAEESETTKWLQLDFGKPESFDQIDLYPAYPTDYRDLPEFGFPLKFKLEASNDTEMADAQVLYESSDNHSGQSTRHIHVKPQQAYRYVRLTASRLRSRDDKKFMLAIGEMAVRSNAKNIALTATVTALDSINSGRWSTRFAVDGFTSRLPLQFHSEVFKVLRAPTQLSKTIDQLQQEVNLELEKLIGSEAALQKSQWQKQLEELNKQFGELPAQAKVYAATIHKGSGAFRGRHGLGPRKIYVLQRGNVTDPQQPVAPGTVGFIAGAPKQFDNSNNEGIRRRQLAEWITDSQNPLTWRSVVNRVWQYHFGHGIVDTPNDFGRGGSLPTHPQLLDWLAIEFRDGGKHLKRQSLKSLHRLILNSRTYQQTSRTERHQQKDGGNQFLWKMNRRRLSAEEIHDTVLIAAGHLNLKMGGPSYQDFVLVRPEHSPHYEYHLHDPLDKSTHRRAVYRMIVRSQPQPFMDTLNCADPSFSVPKRAETLTSLQALGMLNNRFMVAFAEQFAIRLSREHSELKDQLQAGYQILTGSSLKESDLQKLIKYSDKHGLANTCRVLFNLNAFVFVD